MPNHRRAVVPKNSVRGSLGGGLPLHSLARLEAYGILQPLIFILHPNSPKSARILRPVYFRSLTRWAYASDCSQFGRWPLSVKHGGSEVRYTKCIMYIREAPYLDEMALHNIIHSKQPTSFTTFPYISFCLALDSLCRLTA